MPDLVVVKHGSTIAAASKSVVRINMDKTNF